MKISIIGYSASGKSTFAKNIGDILNIPVLHLDKVNFLPNWEERKVEESEKIVLNFIEENNNKFVIDGNYSKFAYDLRMKISDKIIFFDFDRFTCLFQAFQRYNKYKGKVRESMSEGCCEKLDWEFIKWVLFDGRTEERINKYNRVIEQYKDKTIIVKNRKEADDLLEKIKTDKKL